jgi:hypothetical protein
LAYQGHENKGESVSGLKNRPKDVFLKWLLNNILLKNDYKGSNMVLFPRRLIRNHPASDKNQAALTYTFDLFTAWFLIFSN